MYHKIKRFLITITFIFLSLIVIGQTSYLMDDTSVSVLCDDNETFYDSERK